MSAKYFIDIADDDGGMEWYEEPVTIVGFVAGFLLLVLVIASTLILCYSKEDEEDEEEQQQQQQQQQQQHQQQQQQQQQQQPQQQQQQIQRGVDENRRFDERRFDEPRLTASNGMDKTNPLYINANEFDLHPLPRILRANFVHIDVNELTPRTHFKSYYNEPSYY